MRFGSNRRIFPAALISVLPVFFAGCGDADRSEVGKRYRMKIGVTVPVASAQGQVVAAFADKVEAASNGVIETEVFYNAVLGNDSELILKTQIGGQVQASQISISNLSAQLNAFNVFDLPYLFDSADANETLFYEDGTLGGPVVREIQEEAAEKRLRLAWVNPINFRAACMRDVLVKKPQDLDGLKVRTSASALEQACVRALGAVPVALGMSEVYTAIQTGTVDGETIPIWAVESFQHLDAVRACSNVNFQGFTEVLIINNPWYEELPDELKEIIDDAADAVALEFAPKLYGEVYEKAILAIKASGGEWYELSDEESRLFEEKTQSVIREYVGTEKVPQRWYDLVVSRIQSEALNDE